MDPIIAANDKAKIVIRFIGDVANIEYYFDGELVDSMLFPHTNAVINFITKSTDYKENTIRRYIYKNRKDEFVKNNLITFDSGNMIVKDINGLMKALLRL